MTVKTTADTTEHNSTKSVKVGPGFVKVRVWREKAHVWYTQCISHGAVVGSSVGKTANHRRSVVVDWCPQCSDTAHKSQQALITTHPCGWGKEDEICGRQAPFQTINIKGGPYYVCRIHLRRLAYIGITCESRPGVN